MNEDYFLEIEAHFAARRGTIVVFSGKDWALMKSWREEAIPLSIIIEAIDQCFDKREKSGRKRVISGLRFCRHAVKELWAERRDLAIGRTGELPEQDPAALIERLAVRIAECAAHCQNAAMRDVVERASGQVRESAALTSVQKIDGRLFEIESQMIDELVGLVPPEEILRVNEELERVFAGQRGVDEKTLARTRGANLRRHVRGVIGLPPLSLFA